MDKCIMRYVALICALLTLILVGGVFAVWKFYYVPEPKYENISFSVSGFEWTPEEILPTEKPGQNYMDLLDSVLNNSKAGLNTSKGVLKNAVLNDKDGLVHSTQNVQGGNLKHLFITEEARELDFVIKRVSNTEFHIYMYETEAVENGTLGSTKVKVYMTILALENGTWIGRESQFGYATVQTLPSSSTVAIDVNTWAKN